MRSALALVIFLSLATLRSGGLCATAGEPETRSVPVRVLTSRAESSPEVASDAAGEGRLPLDSSSDESAGDPSAGSLPPQYRAGPDGALSSDGGGRQNSSLRFILPLPEQTVLVEARITVDGQPFRMVRERRVDRILDELAKPAAPQPIPDEPNTESDDSLSGRLGRYVNATQRSPTREEIRWILTHWMAGPSLLVLNENFQAIRAHQSPLFRVLDRDGDELISTAEFAAAEPTLLNYDRDQDEVLSFAEIAAAGKPTPADARQQGLHPAPLIPLDDADASSIPGLRFDSDGNGSLDEGELLNLQSRDPDLMIAVAFDTHDPTRSRVEIVSPPIPAEQWAPGVHAGAATFTLAGARLEISAVQLAAGTVSDQLSIGAVRDGYPLLPMVDRDQDGRLTLRELRQLANLIAALDQDRDGTLAAAEILPTIRVAFGQGPIAHRPLATIRELYPPLAPASVTPPEWFTRMDRNQDGDLTSREFLGDPTQFEALDSDGDGLASAAESLAAELREAESLPGETP